MKKYKLNRIKTRQCYNTKEVCQLVGVCRGTVANWIKNGLQSMTVQSTHLVMGKDLKRFLKDKNSNLKKPSQPNEFYCFTCHGNVVPIANSVKTSVRNKIGRSKRLIELQGTCPDCLVPIFKYASKVDISVVTPAADYIKKEKPIFDLPLFNQQMTG